MLPEDTIGRVYDQWNQLNIILSDRVAFTHNAIIIRNDELIGTYYEKIRDKYTSSLDAMKVVYEGRVDSKSDYVNVKDLVNPEMLKCIETTKKKPEFDSSMDLVYNNMKEILKRDNLDQFIWHELEDLQLTTEIYKRLYMDDREGINRLNDKGKSPLDLAIDCYVERDDEKPFLILCSLNAKVQTISLLPMYRKLEDKIKEDTRFRSSKIYKIFNIWIRRHGGLGLWRITRDIIFPECEKDEVDYITGTHSGKRRLRQDVKRQLEDTNNNTTYGRRMVKQVEYEGLKVHVKYFPGLPGNEEAVGILYRELIGWGTPCGELFKLEDGSPVWISLTIEGEVLHEAISKEGTSSHDGTLFDMNTSLDHKSMSDIILMSMIINPEDVKPDNFVIERHPEVENKYRLVCVDNEQCLVPTYVQDELKSDIKTEPVCQVNTYLYAMDIMHQPVHEETKQRFLSYNVEELLVKWMKQLLEVNKKYESLFNDIDLVTRWLEGDNPCFIGFGFQEPYIMLLHWNICLLQACLKENENQTITHIELLRTLEPNLADRYMVLKNSSTSRQSRSCNSDDVNLKTLNSTEMLKEAMKKSIGMDTYDCISKDYAIGPSKSLEVLEKIIKERQTKISDFRQNTKDLEEFLNGFDFNNRIKTDHPVLLKQLYEREFKKLTLRNCSVLDDKAFLKLKLKDLQYLHLTQGDITLHSLKNVSLKSGHLEELRIYDCVKLLNLTDAGLFGSIRNYIEFKNLKVLKIKNCSRIINIMLSLPSIEYLEILGCESLIDINVKAPKLNKVNVSSCDKLAKLSIYQANLTSEELYEITQRFKRRQVYFKFEECKGNRHKEFGNVISKMDLNNYMDYMKLLNNDPSLTSFRVTNSFIDYILEQLKNNTYVSELNILHCVISDKGFQSLSNSAIRILHLFDIYVGDKGCEYLSKINTLIELHLTNNNIGDKGCEYLSKINTLETLYLFDNNIGDKGCEWLSTAGIQIIL